MYIYIYIKHSLTVLVMLVEVHRKPKFSNMCWSSYCLI